MHSLQYQAEAIATAYVPPATGRPSEIADAELLKQLFEAIAAGNYLETACDLVGLSSVSVYAWKKRGEAGERPFDQFARTLKEASARAEAQAVANVRAAGKSPQFWAAEMTYLERRHPDKWGRRQDSNDQPKVVVQIGVSAGDVKVNVITPTFAPPTSSDSLCETTLSGDIESYKSQLCQLGEAPSVTEPAPAETASLATEPQRGPYPGAGAEQPLPVSVGRKGLPGLARKKKGRG